MGGERRIQEAAVDRSTSHSICRRLGVGGTAAKMSSNFASFEEAKVSEKEVEDGSALAVKMEDVQHATNKGLVGDVHPSDDCVVNGSIETPSVASSSRHALQTTNDYCDSTNSTETKSVHFTGVAMLSRRQQNERVHASDELRTGLASRFCGNGTR
jgi:hypothetical protein